MALSQSVLFDLLDVFRGGEGVDLIRDAVVHARPSPQRHRRPSRPSTRAPPGTARPCSSPRQRWERGAEPRFGRAGAISPSPASAGVRARRSSTTSIAPAPSATTGANRPR